MSCIVFKLGRIILKVVESKTLLQLHRYQIQKNVFESCSKIFPNLFSSKQKNIVTFFYLFCVEHRVCVLGVHAICTWEDNFCQCSLRDLPVQLIPLCWRSPRIFRNPYGFEYQNTCNTTVCVKIIPGAFPLVKYRYPSGCFPNYISPSSSRCCMMDWL